MLENTNKTPELLTERLTLRPLTKADVARVSLYSSDWRVASKTTAIPHPNPIELVEPFIERAMSGKRGEQVWAIDATRAYGTDLVGLVSLRDNTVGYWLGTFFWGLGIATEAVGAVVDYACKETPRCLKSSVFMDNPASRRVLEKNGFAVVGQDTQYSLARDKNVDVWTLERPDG